MVLSYAFYQRQRGRLHGSSLAGPEPSLQSFAASAYPAAQSIYLYADQSRIQRTRVQMFLKFAMSDHTAGQRGSLTYEGLIPLPDDEREKHRLEPLLKF